MREPFDLHKDDPLVPYFQYKVGPYQNDHYLYFPTEPNKFHYKTEIFHKMYEYRGFDLVQYIEFHYNAYPDKEEFVRFLRFETAREQRDLRKYRFFFWMRFPKLKAILATTLAWVEGEEKKLQVRVVGAEPVPLVGNNGLMDGIGSEIYALLQTHMGKVDLYNEHQVTKLIQVLRVLRDLRAPGKKVIPLFKSFSDMDMAAILRQFVLFGDKKTNTLQGKIADVGKEMDLDDPALQQLTKALQQFFFP